MTTMSADLAMALDPVLFATNMFPYTLDDWQARVLRWEGQRILLNCARQTGKSTVSALKGLHRALYCPGALILLVSPSLRQSSELFRKVVDFLNRLDVRPSLAEDNRLSVKFENGSRIVSLPSSEATIRGFSGATLIVEDEASRVSDDLYVAVRPMLAVSGGQLVLMSTPYGKRGHFFEEWTHGGEAWERVKVRANECPRISPEFLEEERRALGEHFSAQEYDCEFRDTVDQIFSSGLVAGALTHDVKPLFEAAK